MNKYHWNQLPRECLVTGKLNLIDPLQLAYRDLVSKPQKHDALVQ